MLRNLHSPLTTEVKQMKLIPTRMLKGTCVLLAIVGQQLNSHQQTDRQTTK